MTARTYRMYTDGSYNIKTKVYSGAYAIDGLLEGAVSGQDPEFASARNVAGECLAVIRGIKALIDKEQLVPGDKVIIYHDYTGLAEWAEGRWKAKKPIAIKYLEGIQLYRSKGLIIEFIKVSAHTGIMENEHVDYLAKKAAGIL